MSASFFYFKSETRDFFHAKRHYCYAERSYFSAEKTILTSFFRGIIVNKMTRRRHNFGK